MLQESGDQPVTPSSSSTKTWIAIGVGALLLIIIVVTIILLTTKEDGGWECSNDGDCGNGRYCSNGVCINGCLSDDNCAQYQTCYNGLCHQRCSTDGQCIGGFCESGACVQGCNNNSQCPQGEICSDKVCVVWCGLDAECPEGKACYENRCITGCRTDRDCTGQICNEQKMCVSVACSSNADCPEEWACGDAGYCVRTGCIVDIDCLSGQCIDGVCTEPVSCSEYPCRALRQVCYLVGSSLDGYCRPPLVDYGCYAVPGHISTPFGFIPLISNIPLSDIASPADLDEILVNSLQDMMRRSSTTIAYPFYVAIAVYYDAGQAARVAISWSNIPPASSIGADTIAVNPDNKYCSVVNGTLKVGCNGYSEKYNPIPIYSPCYGIGESSVWRVYQYFPSVYLTLTAGASVGRPSPPVSCPGYLSEMNIGYSGDIINSIEGICPSKVKLPTIGNPRSKQKVSLNCGSYVLGGIQVTGKATNLTSVQGTCYDGSPTAGMAGQIVGSVSSVRCPLPLTVSGYYATTNEQGNLTGIGLACLEP